MPTDPRVRGNLLDYISYGVYAGIAYEILENFDFTAKLGYKGRKYDDFSYTESWGASSANVTESITTSGAEFRVGLAYKF